MGSGLLPLALLVVLSAAAAAPQLAGAAGEAILGIIQKGIIQTVNNHPNAGWTAGHNPYLANYTIEQFKHMLGVKPTPPGLLAGVRTKTHQADQGHCGSCWAFGAVECLQDRFCIHHNMNISLSANDLVACCGFMCGDGCDGGYPISAWQYFVQNGVVTEECDPYFDQVGCKHPGCEPAYPTPVCEKKCKKLLSQFMRTSHYKSGVYKHITGGVMGGHAVKLIGWGTSDAGEDYWLLANQWNRGWGDDGYFKIIRGKNECGIEEDVTAGMPSMKNIAGSAFAM
ncbi:hypothetical protein ZWY2020_053485 [Hordeum vulgare]|nr:hypothetical protein ZWY2020_053485 [Hordeum vulgare]